MRREYSTLLALGVLLIVLALFAPRFFTLANLRDLAVSMAPVLIAATGMTLVILAGQIDISIGSQFAVCTVAMGVLAAHEVPMLLAALLACGLGALLGGMNGWLVAGLGIPSIVATLALMTTLREGLRWGTGGAWIQNLPAGFQWLGLGQGTGQFVMLFLALALFAVFAWCLRHLAAGRAIYATGSDQEAARLAGMNPRHITLGVFICMGLLSGLAAVLNAVRFADVQSNAGVGLELEAIAAVVVGGASITGGRGTLTGTLLGVLLLGAIGPALTFLGISSFWEKAIQGGIILAAVVADSLANRARSYANASLIR